MDEKIFMQAALEEARLAYEEDEVPIGAVITDENANIITKAHNRREYDKNALLHAEIIAINDACKILGGWRLHKCTLYVTLEPCPMCAGAIINSRIKRVVFAAKDPKAGCFGSVLNFNSYPFNHKPEIVQGVCEKESLELMGKFFNRLREKRNEKNY
ncbi:MAG: nucleoside deaminase [Clostridia bacterium]|nr:nucleoside deaminase [Clostridia bacterium]